MSWWNNVHFCCLTSTSSVSLCLSVCQSSSPLVSPTVFLILRPCVCRLLYNGHRSATPENCRRHRSTSDVEACVRVVQCWTERCVIARYCSWHVDGGTAVLCAVWMTKDKSICAARKLVLVRNSWKEEVYQRLQRLTVFRWTVRQKYRLPRHKWINKIHIFHDTLLDTICRYERCILLFVILLLAWSSTVWFLYRPVKFIRHRSECDEVLK